VEELRKALSYTNKAIELNPGIDWVLWQRADINISLGDPVQSMHDFLKSEEMGKGNVFWYRRLMDIGHLYMNIGDFENAEKYLIKSNNARKDSYEGYLALERLYRSNGDFEQARLYADTIKASDKFSSLGGKFIFAEMVLQAMMKDFDGANTTLQGLLKVMNSESTHPSSHYLEGYIYYNIGETETAMDRFNTYLEWSLERAKTANDRLPDLAGVYAILGRREDALATLRKYAKETHWIEPTITPIGWLNLVQVYPLYESLWQDEAFKQIIKEGEDYKAEVRARVDEMVAKEGW
jgi:tetratricopeptide (TPR) repeat protein